MRHERTPRARRGSALLLSLFLTLLGSIVFGFVVDVTSLMWERAKLQAIADAASEAVRLERLARPEATRIQLEAAARAAAAHNGSARLEFDGESVKAAREGQIYFLRMIHSKPVPVSARAQVGH